MSKKKKRKDLLIENQPEDTESNRTGRIGHRQIANQLDRHQMIPSDLSVDKGEDVIVQIGEHERFTGASFYGQFKSKSTLTIRDGVVSCSVKTRHLDRWNASGIPVFLFVADINNDTSYWIEVSDELLCRLDEQLPAWRDKGEITVHLPLENMVDESGTTRIREIVMRRFAPMLAANKTLNLNLKVVFPNTEEGKEGQRQMQRWHDAGDPVLIPSQFVEEFKFSEWFNRWHGGSIAIPPDASLRLTSVPSTKDKIFQVKLLTPNGNVAATRNTIMRVIKRGATEITYTNEHCPTPFRCQLVLRTEKRGVHFTFDIWATGSKTTIQETKQNLPFYKAISLGGTLQITPKDIKSVVKSPTYSSTLTPIEFPILDVEINRLLDRCAYIESKTGARLTLSDLRLTEQDVEDIEYLMTVLQAGHIIREFNVLPLTLTPRPSENGESVLILAQALLETDKSGIPFPISLEVGEVEGYFVGAKISLGPAKNHILGRLAPESREQLQKYIQDPKSVKEMEVVLFDAQMTEEYGDWLPKAFDSDIAPSLT